MFYTIVGYSRSTFEAIIDRLEAETWVAATKRLGHHIGDDFQFAAAFDGQIDFVGSWQNLPERRWFKPSSSRVELYTVVGFSTASRIGAKDMEQVDMVRESHWVKAIYAAAEVRQPNYQPICTAQGRLVPVGGFSDICAAIESSMAENPAGENYETRRVFK